ncbi:DMT family transporter [Calidifontibacillus erzurumensis]|uniref:EamA family transporter n=1 Tax=Calidifontibacillus erzurumensis TaxID=2741433 RepID=A0A8J8GGA0_9BACI|nr:EamA family transporter [Calidifontibacillus erzurumensis]NSL51843.1 EamA family transporter [Calidifontibacillus erzurumensis]
MSKGIIGCLCLLLAAGMWGGMYVVSKYVLEYISPFVLLWFRYILAFAVLWLFWTLKDKQMVEKKDMPFIIWLGFTGYIVSNGCGFIGTHLSNAHIGALISSSSPVFTLILAYLLNKELLSWRKILSIILATCGLFLVVGLEEGERSGSFFGNLLLIIGAVSWALYCVNIKKINRKYSTLTITTFSTGIALLLVTPVMLLDIEKQDLINLKDIQIQAGILYLGIIATTAAFYLWNKGMELMEAGIGSIFYFFAPVIGGLLGFIFLGEKISNSFIFGGLLIFIGTFLPFLNKSNIYIRSDGL